MKKTLLLLCVIGMLNYACSTSNMEEQTRSDTPKTESTGEDTDGSTGEESQDNIWSIPISEVFDGGPGKDGIPSLQSPEFITTESVTYLSDEDLVIGFKNGSEVKAYPHVILDWHEIINDFVGDTALAVTYCPLTGTGLGWNRDLGGFLTTFGVSGLLYNTNLIPYDRTTDSNWSQILNEAVNGQLRGQEITLLPLVEMDWGTWKRMFPVSQTVSTNTGYSRTYGISPYGDYNTNNNRFLFPVPKDNRLPLKERVHAILDDGQAKVYRFQELSAAGALQDDFNGKSYLLVGNSDFMTSFELEGEYALLDFTFSYEGSEEVFTDNENNSWNIFGEAISGPRIGECLKPSRSLMAFWFSIPAFYPTEIYSP